MKLFPSQLRFDRYLYTLFVLALFASVNAEAKVMVCWVKVTAGIETPGSENKDVAELTTGVWHTIGWSSSFSSSSVKLELEADKPEGVEFQYQTPSSAPDFNEGLPSTGWASDSATVIQVRSAESAEMTVKLLISAGAPAAEDELAITFGGCGGCAGGDTECGLGSGGGSNESGGAEYSAGFGPTAGGSSAGSVGFYSAVPSEALSTPGYLKVIPGKGSAFTYDGNGVLTSATMPRGSMTVDVVDAYSYRLIYKDSSQNVIRTTTISNPDGATSTDRLHIVEDADVDRAWVYEWDDTDEVWSMSEGASVTSIERKYSWSTEVIDDAEKIKTLEVQDDQQNVVNRTAERSISYSWGSSIVERVEDPSDSGTSYVGADRSSTWVYYLDATDADNYGKLRMQVNPSQDWIYYEYEGEGRVARRIMSKEGELPPDLSGTVNVGTLAGDNVETVYDYFEIDLSNGDSDAEDVDRMVVKDEGTNDKVYYEIEWTGTLTIGSVVVEEFWDIEAVTADPESGYASTTAFLSALVADSNYLGHRVSKTWRIAYLDGSSQEQDRPFARYKQANWDGTVAFWTYVSDLETVVSRGYPNGGGTAVVHGSRTTSKVDAAGNAVSTLVERIDPAVNSGNWFVASFTKTLTDDVFGRPTSTGYYFGAEAVAESASSGTGVASYSTSQTYGCCGVETRTDRYGIVTSYTYDALGRTSSMTRADGTSGEVTLHYTYDAAGRTVQVEREGVGQSPTVDGESEYDLAGRMTSQEDAGSKKMFYTYRRVKADATVFDPQTDTGVFYWETRVYPHNKASGPVRVSWADSQGRTVLSLSGTVASDWNGSAPGSIADLSEVFTRTEMDYDWEGRVEESRSYHDFGSLSVSDLRKLATPGSASEGTHYYVETGGVYDVQDRMVRSTDVLGNITATVYDDEGRAIETWVGTDATSATPDDPTGNSASGNNMVQVSGMTYDSYGELTASKRLKPVASLTSFASDSVAVNVEDEYTVSGGAATGRESWGKPADSISPWSKQVYDEQGRMTESITYDNGSTSYILAKTTQVYDDTTPGKGRLVGSRTHEVNGSGGLTGDYLETTYAYDDANRQFKTTSPGSGYSVTVYDAVGRVERSLVVADDNGTDVVTDDVVATETVYGYDAADNVIWTENYARRHDTPGSSTGLLSANPTWARVTYSAIWYDDAHRPTHVVDYGDTSP